MAKVKAAAGKAGKAATCTGQQPLSVRERQVIGAVFGAVDKIESTPPGAIHSSEIIVGRRGLHVRVVYNHDRGVWCGQCWRADQRWRWDTGAGTQQAHQAGCRRAKDPQGCWLRAQCAC